MHLNNYLCVLTVYKIWFKFAAHLVKAELVSMLMNELKFKSFI